MEIKLNQSNPRFIKDDKFKKLVQSIRDFPKMLELRPIVVDRDGIILGGNMRYRAIQELGLEMKDEWVKVADKLTDEERRRFIVEDNVGFGDWDWDLLANEYEKEELEEWGMDVDKWVDDEVVEDEVPEVADNPVSKLGEVYQLGRHRLMCGDSTKIEDVEKLMDGKKADMVFTDPPYGVAIVNNSSVGGGGALKFGGKAGKFVQSTKGFSEIIGDDTTDTARDCYNFCVSLGIDKQIFWGGNYFTDFLPPSPCWLVWNKKNTGNFADVEMAWTNFKTGAKLYDFLWNGLSREGDRASELVSRVHPTQKPVGLYVNILRDYSKDNEIVLDLFLGSGSTLIACEQTNRICYGMEIDSKYIDVIRKRYAKFIGKEEEWETVTPRI